VHPEVVANGARRLRRFNFSTPLRSGNFSVFPAQTPKRAEARAPTNTNNLRMQGLGRRCVPERIMCVNDAVRVVQPHAAMSCLQV
jgi:hypothetical protein